MTPYRVKRRVEFHETDSAGIVHFSNFFRYMESAEVEFLRSRGLSVTMPWDGEKIGLPRVSATCDFFKPIRFDEDFEIAVTIVRLGTKSVTYGFEFTKGNEVVARGKVASVCCRVREDNSLEPIPIPPGYRGKLEDAAK